MHIRELHDLARWFEQNFVGPRVLKQYNALLAALNANVQAGAAKQAVETPKNQLQNTLRLISTASLTEEQRELLYEMGVGQALGPDGAGALDDILTRAPIDPVTAAQKVQAIVRQLDAAVKKFEGIKSALQGIEDEPLDRGGGVLLRVRFRGEAAIENVKDLREWANHWFDIGRGIAMAQNTAPEDIRVVGASTGSIIIELMVAYGIAKLTSAILLEALRVAERVLQIRAQAEQVRTLHLANDRLAQQIEAEAEQERQTRIEQVVKNVSGQVENIDGEKQIALTKSIEKLVNFTEKGGKIDYVVPSIAAADADASNTADDLKELAQVFEQIRGLEEKVWLLEHKPIATT